MSVSRKEAEALVRSFVSAWNAHDAGAMAHHWWEDGDVVNPFGRRAEGSDEIVALLRDEHSRAMRESRLVLTIESCREVAADVAVADIRGVIENVHAPNGGTFALQHRLFAIITRRGERYAFASARASVAPL